MVNLKEALGQYLYEEVLGKKETHLTEFTLLNAWKFFIDCCMDYPRIKLCGLAIERKGDHFEINQCMLNASGDMIRAKGDFSIGRKIQAYELDDDLMDYMNGDTAKIMDISALKK